MMEQTQVPQLTFDVCVTCGEGITLINEQNVPDAGVVMAKAYELVAEHNTAIKPGCEPYDPTQLVTTVGNHRSKGWG
jgi:threonine dehydratase